VRPWHAVIVATPGRLRDFMNDGDIKLDRAGRPRVTIPPPMFNPRFLPRAAL